MIIRLDVTRYLFLIVILTISSDITLLGFPSLG
ncbi:hypothetical protein LINPERPRIM_LOCUS3161 [Linum perenne]